MKFSLGLLALAISMAVGLGAKPAPVLIRVPTGMPIPSSLPPLLARWQQSGHVAKVLFLTDGKPETPDHPAQFAALAVLEFADDASAETWQKQDAPNLPPNLIVRQADVLATSGSSAPLSAHPVFVVNTYTPTVSPETFRAYVAGYVQPLYEAMYGTKLLATYTCYLERDENGKPDALNVLQYADAEALKTMGKRKGSIRDRVAATVPSYAHYDKIKDTLRVDGHGTIATYTPIDAGTHLRP